MLRKLLDKQKSNLDYFFSHLDLSQCERVIEEVLCTSGILFFTGVGKSGFIAQKVAATLMSTGTKSLYLPAIDALHGDLGIIDSKDLVFIFSKSGETEELFHLLPHLRNKGVKTIALTANRESRLARGVDLFVELPCQSELCPFDLTPTTSSEIQLLFGDLLAIALIEAKGVTLRAFAENHPAGSIGKRVTVKVRDLMLDQNQTPFCTSSQRLEEVLIDFSDKKCGCLVVIDEKRRLKGIFTDGDLRRALQKKGENILKEKIENLMTKSPKAINHDSLAWEAVKMMEADPNHPIMVLPVLDQGQVVGLIKMHDLIQAGI